MTRGDVVFRPATAEDWPAIWPIVRAVVSAGDTYMYPTDLDEEALVYLSGNERVAASG